MDEVREKEAKRFDWQIEGELADCPCLYFAPEFSLCAEPTHILLTAAHTFVFFLPHAHAHAHARSTVHLSKHTSTCGLQNANLTVNTTGQVALASGNVTTKQNAINVKPFVKPNPKMNRGHH
jgi:hypothetical protein